MQTDQLLDLNATQDQSNLIALPVAPVAVEPPEVVKRKATRYDVAMGGTSPGVSAITSILNSGGDQALRDQVVQETGIQFEQRKFEMLQSLVKSQDGRPVSKEETDFVMGMSKADLKEIQDASDIMETQYAKHFLEGVVATNDEPMLDESAKDPEKANVYMDRYQDQIKKNALIHKKLDEVDTYIQNQGWGETAWNIGENIVFPLNTFRLNNAAGGAPIESIAPGSNRKEQYDYLRGLPSKELQGKLDETVKYLMDKNPYLAKEYLSQLLVYSGNDQFLDNVSAGLDVTDLVTAGLTSKLLKKGVSAALKTENVLGNAFKNQLKGAVKASIPREVKIAKVAEAVGEPEVKAVAENINRVLKDSKLEGVDDLAERVPSIINPGKMFTGETNLGGDLVRRVWDRVQERALKAWDMFGTDLPPRLLEARKIEVVKDVVKQLVEEVGGKPIQKRLLDVSGTGNKFTHLTGEVNKITNTDTVSVHLGTGNGLPFTKANLAEKYAEKLRETVPTAKVEPWGSGYMVTVTRDMPESWDYWKNADVTLPDKHKTGMLNALIGNVLGARQSVADSDIAARLVTVHGSQHLYEMYKPFIEPIAKLSGKARKEVEWVLNKYKHELTPDGNKGVWLDTIEDFEDAFRAKFNKLPTEDQVDSYFAYRQASDLDYAIRNVGIFRDKARVGIETWQVDFSVPQPAGKGKAATNLNITADFNGKKVNEIPIDDGLPGGIAIYDPETKQTKIIRKEYLRAADREQLEEINKGGWDIIQAENGNLKVPRFDKEFNVAFFVTKGLRRKRLSVTQLPYQGGGHFVNRYQYYVKQGIVKTDNSGKKYYTGDISFLNAPTEALARKAAKAADEARLMLKANDPRLDEFVVKNLGMDGKTFAKHFQKTKNAKGETVDGLDIDTPITFTKSGQRTNEVMNYAQHYGKDNFKDAVDNPYNLLTELDRKFTQERDAGNIPVIHEEAGTVHIQEDGELLDPFATLDLSARGIVNTRAKRDYFLRSTQHWMEQFHHLMDVPLEELRRNATKYFYNPRYLDGADWQEKMAAENIRKNIIGFMGQHTDEESKMELLKTKIANYAYSKAGKKGLDVAENWVLPVMDDPFKFGRSLAFHLKLGLFNPIQLFVQAQTMSNVVAIAGKAGLQGMGAYFPLRAALINPRMLEHSAQVATKLGWTADEFKEMHDALVLSGWSRLAGDQAILDDVADPGFVSSKFGKVLDWGTVFFKEGEKATRISAYAAAYKEWKAANLGKKLNLEGRTWILNRADQLTVNMSAANNAVWQKGIFSLPAQFMTYQLRLAEQYIGKGLTNGEKARLFAVHSLLYGLPTAAGGATIVPAYEMIKQQLINNNVQYDDTALEAVLDGIPSMGIEMFGGVDIDVGPRYGPGGASILRDIWRGEAGFTEVIGGPAGKISTDVLAATWQGAKAFGSLLTTDDSVYPMTVESFLDVAKNASSFNNADKLIHALNTGEWLSKNGGVIDEVNGYESFAQWLTGASLQRQSDAFVKMDSIKDMKDYQEKSRKQIIEWLVRSMKSEDPTLRRQYASMAKSLAYTAKLTPREQMNLRLNALRRAAPGGNFVDSIAKQFDEDVLDRMGN